MKTINNHNYDQGTVDEIIAAIRQFVKRQELIKLLISDLGITAEELSNDGPLSWRNKNISQDGVWLRDQQWQYFLHGTGCRLSNLVTGEVIDWSSKQESAISVDPYMFIKHLDWRLKRENSFPNIQATINEETELKFFLPLIFEIINQPEQFE